MTKVITPLTIDYEIKKKAKEAKLNMSQVAEEAISERLKLRKVTIDTTIEKCEFCGREQRKATADDLDGLSWLYPDEKWICNSCLKVKSKNIIK